MLAVAPVAANALNVKVGVLRETHSRETLSILDIPAADDTLAGALLGVADNNTTGKFTNQTLRGRSTQTLDEGDDVAAAVDALVRQGRAAHHRRSFRRPSARAPPNARKPHGALLFNVSARRTTGCARRSAAPMSFMSRRRASMLADGLTQYLVWKQWRRWLLIKGSHPNDELLAQAYRRASAKKFGAKIVDERVYEDTERRTAQRFRLRADAAADARPDAERAGL